MYGKVQLLRNETLKSFNVDINITTPKTLQLVYVSCECGEIFTRRYHIATRLHRCSIYRTLPDGTKIKWCNSCQQFLSYDKFGHDRSPRATEGLAGHCLKCVSGSARKNRSSFDGWLHHYAFAKQSACKNKKIVCNIDEDYIRKLWNDQTGKCFYTSVNLLFNSKKLAGASLDRKEPTKGYTRGNVVWCSIAFNRLKHHASLQEVASFLAQAKFRTV